jgi:dipeptidyl aminopeptidase/acylaminoacyl peptidase
MFLALLVSLPAASQQKDRVLDAASLMDMESVAAPAISPDGREIVFTRSWSDKVRDQERSNLWIVDRDGARLRELTHGNWRDSSPVWSPDGRRIAFLSDRDGTTQIHTMFVDTREVAQLTHLTQRPSDLTWSPDGTRLAFVALVEDDDPILTIKLPAKPKGAEWAKPAILIDRLAWRQDGAGPEPKGYRHIYVVDAIVGGTPRKITDGAYNHGSPEWSVDGRTIFATGIRRPNAEYEQRDTEIYAIDVKNGAVKALTDRKGADSNPRVSPDGKWIAYSGWDDKQFTYHLANLYLMDPSGGGKRTLLEGQPDSPLIVEWARDSSGLYYSMNERGTSNMYFAGINGKVKKITDGEHVLNGYSMAPNGQTAAIRSNFHLPGALVSLSVDRPALKTLVDVNSDVMEGTKLGEVETIWATSKDGLKVQGWLVKPVDFDASKKYPMVLFIHGGPWSAYTVAFQWAWQNFAANGYALLYMNPRGSTGYGQEFVNGIQYSYPGKDFDDLMAGVDAAVAKGWIDDHNLFVCGGSGGGVLTAWIVGHTNRFRAAVSMRPVINWHSFVGTTDGAMWYKQFRKFPWEDPVEYAERSPLHYVARVTTPTMVLTGEADLRTPISQSEEYYRALKMLKKETLLVRIPEEYHGFRRPSHRLAQQLYLLAWFEKYRVKDLRPSSSGGQP